MPLTDPTSTRRPTLADVARRCGLSKAAVSLAVNHSPDRPSTLKEETRRRIVLIAEEMGYRASWRGRVLASRRSQMIAVVYAHALPQGVYTEIGSRIDEELNRYGYTPIFIHVPEGDDRFERMLDDQRFDGCLSLASLSDSVMRTLRGHKVPTVLINAAADASWSCVNVNDEAGTILAMRHLYDLGHRRIAYYGGEQPPHPSVIIRAATYQRFMNEAGLAPDEPFTGPIDAFGDRVTRGGAFPATAMLTFDHRPAIALLQHFWRRGVRVPGDVSLVTFNDAYPVEQLTPPLTVIGLPVRQMGEHAVRLLVERLDRPQLTPEIVLLDEHLIVRESTAAAASMERGAAE
ncbi:MAG: LacI family DNA-binding transcriptional regulator [Tepidisphaeraceae bacterium]